MKKALATAIVLMLVLALSSCIGPGLSDWRYPLPCDYEVWHVNSQTIVFGKKSASASLSTVIDPYVSAFCYNEDHAVVERLPNGKDTEPREYYIVSLREDAVSGPYDRAELDAALEDRSIGGLCDWIATSPAPSGAVFP